MNIINKKIKEKLEDAAALDPTKKTYSDSILSLCKKIEKNKLTIPVYQRNLSWSNKKSVDLFNFQLFGKAPVSAISIINIDNDIDNSGNGIKQLKFISRTPIKQEGRFETVIDGQQRLSTTYKAYMGDSSFDIIVLDLSKGMFRELKSNTTPTKKQIPVTKLLNKNIDELRSYLKDKLNSNEFEYLYPLILQIRNKLLISYSYTINIADDLTFDEQKKWFEILNNAGTRVKGLQLELTNLNESYNIDMYNYFDKFKEVINNIEEFKILYKPFSTKDTYPTCALNPWYESYYNKAHNNNCAPIPSDTKTKLIVKLPEKELNDICDKTINSLKNTILFIKCKQLTPYINRMDYILYLLGYFAFKNDDITEEQKKSLVDWVKKVNFKNASNSKRRAIFNELIKL